MRRIRNHLNGLAVAFGRKRIQKQRQHQRKRKRTQFIQTDGQRVADVRPCHGAIKKFRKILQPHPRSARDGSGDFANPEKQICTPYMGAYLKRMSIARGMRINRYSCQLRIDDQARCTRDFLLKTGMECMFFRLFSSNIGGRQPCLLFALGQGSRRLPSVQVPGKPLAALRSICLYAACQHAQRNASLRARQEPKFTS